MNAHRREVDHWAEVETAKVRGDRLFWLNHPRVAHHYYSKAQLDGRDWRDWVVKELGRKPRRVLELGCGDGQALHAMAKGGYAESITGLDLDFSRFAATADQCKAQGISCSFLACDVNAVELPAGQFDLIYALQSVHHFENLEHVFAQCSRALVDDGLIVLDEFVGPNRFQWTDAQLALTGQLLSLLPPNLRHYRHGMLKHAEGRSTVQQVIDVCPSEAVRSEDILGTFEAAFDVIWSKKLGGTIQHLLYSGIIQNFPDEDEYTLRAIDNIDSLERMFIDHGILKSDFALLVGRKKSLG